ncbi:PPOX class F420-dependent oxidoreductase [Nocardia tengchongensis]|uniref:PPOX class F420-dependent oxidoreductase n=1 Tax=Nocardia tengchongensis TaxID=2055889 RepID=A0ABX8CKC0_9NOCA|nr:PPOX class F420-dependent oxidoreductase [Nocardia tengchongensis]QVI19771.1 PPOX class F420-dependent oxidoreductase [Nocardia tengchongensis]
MDNPFGPVGTANYVNLTTYKKDGTPVGTPLWAALDGGRLYVWTVTDSWKVKRIRRNPEVTVQACDVRGKTRGEIVKGRAVILDDAGSERTRGLVQRKYGIMGWLTITLSKVRRGSAGTIGIEITAA